jgi:hemerythrin-like domain-containing protein
MNAAQFEAVLKTVEEDHQMVLDKMQALKDVVHCLLEPKQVNAPQLLTRFQEIHDYFATQFEAHLDEEDTTLFPLLEQSGSAEAELVGRLRDEHDQIRRKRAELSDCLHIARELEDALPEQVMLDLLAYGWGLWDLLDRHAHEETRAVQDHLTRFLRRSLPAPGQPRSPDTP